MAVHPLECTGMRYLGQDDLAGRGNCGEGIALLERGGRRYLYIAHVRGPANFSVLDVTDPTAPRLINQTTLPHGSVRSNSLAVSGEVMVVAYQVDRPGERPAGIEVYDLSRCPGSTTTRRCPASPIPRCRCRAAGTGPGSATQSNYAASLSASGLVCY